MEGMSILLVNVKILHVYSQDDYKIYMIAPWHIGFYIHVLYKDSTKNALVTNNGDTHVINNAMSLDPGNKFRTWHVTMMSSVAS